MGKEKEKNCVRSEVKRLLGYVELFDTRSGDWQLTYNNKNHYR